jgi:uncharacterized protein (TIGR03083 family)
MTTNSADEAGAGQTSDQNLQARLEGLRASARRLQDLVTSLSPDALRQQAYPSEWTIADVLSHLGSGAIITLQRLEGEADAQAIWDEWNAKTPDAQASDALVADQELLGRLDSLTEEDQRTLRFPMGPLELDLASFLGLRLNEHVVHTWDVAVALDRLATIPSDAAELVVDNLSMIGRFAGKPTGAERTISVRTTEPTRYFVIDLQPEAVALSSGDPTESPDIELPAEAFVRLVYGRLDVDHSPTTTNDEAILDELRRAYPGF